ncbi:hypothetical protein [Bradyrhizobium sp.]|uniref:hypothetical protein n=1 Tax=Bradyrhizobium sp. TaxID=376 RepID=UPI0025B965BA|nr:hypothetical protein [Bradyrhizobium sp.]
MMSFVVGIAGVAVFSVLARVMQSAARGTSPVAILAIAAILSHLASVALGIIYVPQFQYWSAASIFSFGVMSYVFVFGAVYKSVSLEVLLAVAGHPDRAVPLPYIVGHQVPEIFRGRIQILIESGLVEQIGSTFAATAAGERLAARIARLRRMFAIGDSGLYDFPD